MILSVKLDLFTPFLRQQLGNLATQGERNCCEVSYSIPVAAYSLIAAIAVLINNRRYLVTASLLPMLSQSSVLDASNLEEVFTSRILTVSPETAIEIALHWLGQDPEAVASGGEEHPSTGYVLVIANAQLLGVFTEQDVLRLSAAGQTLTGVAIAQVMTPPPMTLVATEIQSIFTPLEVMQQHQLAYLPVINARQQFLGLITAERLQRVLQRTRTAALEAENLLLLQHRAAELEQLVEQRAEELALSEARYRAILEAQTELVCCFLADGTLTFVNDACCCFWGKSKAELLGSNLLTTFSDQDCLVFRQAIAPLSDPAAATGTLEIEMPNAQQIRCWLQWTIKAIFTPQGRLIEYQAVGREITAAKPAAAPTVHGTDAPLDDAEHQLIGVVGVSGDMTERQSLEAALPASETWLNHSLNSAIAAIGSFRVFPDGDYQHDYISAGCEMIYGYTAEELLANSSLWESRVLPEDREAVIQPSFANIYAERIFTIEYRFQDKTNHLRWISETLMPQWQGDTACWRVTSIATDISDRKHSELALQQLHQELEAKYRSIYENAVTGIFQTTPAGSYLSVNPALARMHGYDSPEEMIQQLTQIDRQLYVDSNRRQEFLQILQEQDTVLGFEAEVYRKDGSRFWVCENARVVRDATGAVLYYEGSSTDISDRKQAEAKLQGLLAEKELLLEEVHHRVKNNLQVISSILSLKAQTIDDPQGLTILRDSQQRILSIALIYEELYQSRNLVAIPFSDYLRRLTRELFCAYCAEPERIRLQIEMQPVYLNPNTAVACGLLLNELISNALKHAFPGEGQGEIRITLFQESEGKIYLGVEDNGVGLPQDWETRLQNTLGLRLVRALTQQLQGQLTIDSYQGGTRCQVSFAQLPSRKGS